MSAQYDLTYVTAVLGELEDYLLSKELFWPLSIYPPPVGPSYPKLTVGNLLLSFARLRAYRIAKKLDAGQDSEFTRLEREFHTLKRKWAVAWEEKTGREFISRLRQWSHTLNEVARNADTHAPYYQHEVRLRVLLELLQDEMDEPPPADLDALDGGLQPYFKPGEFIWDADLEGGFPHEKYWFLWGDVT